MYFYAINIWADLFWLSAAHLGSHTSIDCSGHMTTENKYFSFYYDQMKALNMYLIKINSVKIFKEQLPSSG